MKKTFIFFALICVTLSLAFASDSFTMNTTLNYSKPGGVKSDSHPTMSVGEIWNLEISMNANGRVQIKRLWTGIRNFFLGQQEAIVVEIKTNITPDELKITTEKNLIPYKMKGEMPYCDESNTWWYVYCVSPKQKNQQISFQFVPKSNNTEHRLSIQYFYINNADDSFFEKDAEYSTLNYKNGFGVEGKLHGSKVYIFAPLTNSDILYNFDVK